MLPDPHESLTIFAEVSVALSGFSGIVIAFGSRSIEALSALEARRLANLFMLSGFALIVSLLAISLLYIPNVQPHIFWSVGSGLILVLGTAWLIGDVYKVLGLSKAGTSINFTVVTIFDSLAAIGLLMQLYNIVWTQAPWPFFLALTLITVGAFQQFILLVKMRIRVQPLD
jgi:hypothetical protein